MYSHKWWKMHEMWRWRVQFPEGSCCPGCSLRSHPGVICTFSHPCFPPSWKKGVKQQLSAKAVAKGWCLSCSQTEKLLTKTPSNGHSKLHSFLRLLTSLPWNFLCLLTYPLQGNVLLSHHLWSEPELWEANSSLLAIIKFVRSQIQQWNCYLLVQVENLHFHHSKPI